MHIKGKSLKFTLLILLSLIYSSCFLFPKREVLYSTKTSVYYKVPKSEITGSKLYIKEKFEHPYVIEPKTIEDILGNLRYKKTTRINEFKDYIFEIEELSRLAIELKEVFENIKPDEAILAISLYNHTKSVISNYKRTDFLMWVDSKGLNVVFGEIQTDLSRNVSSNFFEWSQIPEIHITITPDENEIIPDTFYTFNKVKGFANKKWLLFPLDDLSKYKLQDRKEVEVKKQ